MKRDLALAAEDNRELAKRAKHKRWEWCRLRNGFVDDPLWRVVAAIANVPLYQVQAFVVRLEGLANKSVPRGYVGDFSAVEFAAAHGMLAEEAARIFAALEHDDVQWIDQDHVATFYDRNPDKEDETAPERDKRRKARRWLRRELKKRLDVEAIDEEQHGYVLAMLKLMTDAELFDFKARLRSGAALEAVLSTGHIGHGVAFRGHGEATPRTQHSKSDFSAAVDNSGATPRGETQGLPEKQGKAAAGLSPEAAELWLAGEGLQLLVERLHEHRTRAVTLIARWRRDLDDDPVVTATLIAGLADRPLNISRLELLVGEFIKRRRTALTKGEPLPLPPVPAAGFAPQATRHAVAPASVDKSAADGAAIPGTGTDG